MSDDNKWKDMDQLSILFTEIEGYFRKLNLGVDAWVVMPDQIDPSCIGFCKLDGSWQICFQKNGPTMPLKNAPMEFRLMSVGYLTLLEGRLKSVFEKRQIQAKEALEDAEKWISSRIVRNVGSPSGIKNPT
jgi:hypothetical protein